MSLWKPFVSLFAISSKLAELSFSMVSDLYILWGLLCFSRNHLVFIIEAVYEHSESLYCDKNCVYLKISKYISLYCLGYAG